MFVTVLSVVFIIETVFVFELVTYKEPPSWLMETPDGYWPTGIEVTN